MVIKKKKLKICFIFSYSCMHIIILIFCKSIVRNIKRKNKMLEIINICNVRTRYTVKK